MRIMKCVVSLALFYAAALALAAPSPSPSSGPSPSPGASPSASLSPGQSPSDQAQADAAKAAEKRDKRQRTLRFGTDAEIGALLKELTEEKEDAFNADCLSALKATRSAALKAALLGFLGGRGWGGAQDEAAAILTRGEEEEGEAALKAALEYGAALSSKSVFEAARPLLSQGLDGPYALALIKLTGRCGGPEEEALLLDTYKDVDTNIDMKTAILSALKDMELGQSSLDFLEALALNTNEKRALRTGALTVLSKYENDSSKRTHLELIQDPDPYVRAQAASGLGRFPGDPETVQALADAIRDSNDIVRAAAVKAAGQARLVETIGSLEYRTEYDPSSKIRDEALRALAAIGDQAAWDTIASLCGKDSLPEAQRLTAFGIILEAGRSELYPLIKTRLKKESDTKQDARVGRLASLIGEKGGEGFDAEAEAFMRNADLGVRLNGIRWTLRTRCVALIPVLERLRDSDPNSQVRAKAAEALQALRPSVP